MTYIDQDPTTQVFYRTTPIGEDDTVFLHYVFWSFSPRIDGFKYCKPIISINRTHLYDKYQGKLLVTMAIDANSKVFLLAFAVMDCESGSSWRWFLQCLRDTIGHVILDEGICIISDQHLSIKNAIANWPKRDDGRTHVFHRYCLQHVASNFNTHFQNLALKSATLKARYATQVVKFDTIIESIKQVEIEAIRNKKKVTGKDGKEKNQDYLPCTYLMSEFVDMWTESHDGGRRFGAMTTNISQCFKGVLKGARGFPIAAMVEFTQSKLVEYFHDQHKEYLYELLESKKWSEYAFSTWDGNKCKSEKYYLKAFSNEHMIYQVVISFNMCSAGGKNHSYEVRLRERNAIVGNGKTQESRVHMQLEYVMR